MITLTKEERSRICVAKFRDMPDDMLSEMPGTVLELADKYYKTSNKLRKISDLFLEVVEHLPVDVMRHVMAELSAYLVTSGEKTMSEVIADIEASRDKMEKK